MTRMKARSALEKSASAVATASSGGRSVGVA
ncbi:hypothetical protein BJ970_006763 [Saccharopolyspora phatthalungensis]|uniref:Uncharacterized protein n=1 Tax=Saccharopolyspora phatthalungensis TaxID=664693 RepID=A0A840QED3_9PSEU|nr:hypothetical protein [Saccharopolyspora phatthalungensis]